MAGSYGSKPDPKIKNYLKNNNNEALKDFSGSHSIKNENKLFGILLPGQSIELNKKETSTINWNREFLLKTPTQEQAIYVSDKNQETQKEIKELLLEIKKLSQNTENLKHEIIQATEQNVVNYDEYQLNFLQRIKMVITNFRKNINEAANWLEMFNRKKSKKNAFWNRAKSKNGGEQYLMSSEHSASRSAN